MAPPRILLIQARDAADPMGKHERACIRKRLGGHASNLIVKNGVDDHATPDWLDGADAIIIGGSGDYSVHHPKSAPWVSRLRHVIDRALADRLPGFGICFGHQLLGYHLGADVVTDETRAEVGTVEVHLTDAGRDDPLFAAFDGGRFHAHTGHSDHVTHVPDELELLASNDTLETQAFRVRGTRFYTTQFHPDLTGAEAVARYEAIVQTRPEAKENLARFAPGLDASAALLSDFVSLIGG